jgi:hypothetical protein
VSPSDHPSKHAEEGLGNITIAKFFSCPGVPSRRATVPPEEVSIISTWLGSFAREGWGRGGVNASLAGKPHAPTTRLPFLLGGGIRSPTRDKNTRYGFIGSSWTPWGRSEQTESLGLEDLSLVLTQQCQFDVHLNSLIGWCRWNEGVIVAYSSFPSVSELLRARHLLWIRGSQVQQPIPWIDYDRL